MNYFYCSIPYFKGNQTLNFLEIVNAVCLHTDITQLVDTEAPNLDDSQKIILDYVNEVIFELHALDNNWRWGQQETTITLLPNVSSYTIPSTINADTIDVVRIGKIALNYVDKHIYDLDRLKYEQLNDKNKPYYTIFNNEIIIIQPDLSTLGNTLYITYQLRPVDLVKSDDEPAIPYDFHRAIVAGAEFKIKKFYNWPDALKCEESYNNWKRMMLGNNKDFGQAQFKVQLDAGFPDDWIYGLW